MAASRLHTLLYGTLEQILLTVDTPMSADLAHQRTATKGGTH
jgi:hypothetical protein